MNYLGDARTNNAAEGWNHAIQQMSYCKHPTIYKFIDVIRKDHDFARTRMASCEAGLNAAEPKKEQVKRHGIMRKAVQKYDRDTQEGGHAISETNDSNDDSEDGDDASQTRVTRSKSQVESVYQNPFMILLNTIAHNIGKLRQ